MLLNFPVILSYKASESAAVNFPCSSFPVFIIVTTGLKISITFASTLFFCKREGIFAPAIEIRSMCTLKIVAAIELVSSA